MTSEKLILLIHQTDPCHSFIHFPHSRPSSHILIQSSSRPLPLPTDTIDHPNVDFKHQESKMKMPIQRLARSHDRKFLVMASNALLQVIDLKTGQILSSSSTSDPGSHSGLIRLLAIHQDSKEEEEEAGQNQKSILISTGEDKLLKTWELPSLKLLQSR